MEETKKVKLNLACGNDYREGYLNIDNQTMFDCKVDRNADIFTLGWGPRSVDEILVNHFIMYTRPEDLQPLLDRWYTWLKLDGRLVIECIDLQKVMRIALEEPDPLIAEEYGLVNIFGNKVTGPHKWGWTPEKITNLLFRSGFRNVKESQGNKKPMRDFKLVALK